MKDYHSAKSAWLRKMTQKSDKELNHKQKKALELVLFADNSGSEKDSTEVKFNTFVIIDAAKDGGIPYYLDGLDAEYACLLNNDEAKKLGSVAPYLVQLEPNSKVTDWFLNKLYGNSIGFAFQTRQSLESMRVHWKNQFRSKIPGSNEKGFFRFYDPKVLRPYLSVLDEKNENALSRFISHCENFLVESTDKKLLLRYWRNSEEDNTLSSNEICLDKESSVEQVEQSIG